MNKVIGAIVESRDGHAFKPVGPPIIKMALDGNLVELL